MCGESLFDIYSNSSATNFNDGIFQVQTTTTSKLKSMIKLLVLNNPIADWKSNLARPSGQRGGRELSLSPSSVVPSQDTQSNTAIEFISIQIDECDIQLCNLGKVQRNLTNWSFVIIMNYFMNGRFY